MPGDQCTHAPVDSNVARHRHSVLTQPIDVPVPNVQLTKRFVRRVERRDTLDVLGVADPTRQYWNATRRRLENTQRSTLQLRTAYERVDTVVQLAFSVASENVHGLESSAATNVYEDVKSLDPDVLFYVVSSSYDSKSPNRTCHLVRPRKHVSVCAERCVRRVDAVLFHLLARLVRNTAVPGQRTVTVERLFEKGHTLESGTMSDDDEPLEHVFAWVKPVQGFQAKQTRV